MMSSVAPVSSSTSPPDLEQYSSSPLDPRSNEQTYGPSPPLVSSEPAKKKQKRNKPTLSCEECVERKTKCDRLRPDCTACIKRQSECQYAPAANRIDETNRLMAHPRRITKPPRNRSLPQSHTNGSVSSPQIHRERSRSASSSLALLSDVPYSHPTASNVFGIGSEHPFANYWTCQGGLAEVVSVLPERMQADILMDRYFECVDPVYPMIHRQTFYADYEQFWSLLRCGKNDVDGALVALIFSMLAMGTQFETSNSTKQTAEFYVSAAHQALRMSSYLNKTSISSIQSMVLITYFLVNDNHASDGWAFAGILIRQAYAMGLHRDPNIVVPNASVFDKQQRRKLWQAVLLQDTFLTVLLSLPPSATHTDVSVKDLVEDTSSIASASPTDLAYIRCCWALANLVQETVCSPRSLDLPICSSPRQKANILAEFRSVYRSFPDVFRSWTPASITTLAQTNKRLVRQTLFLTSNYWHNIMLVHESSSPQVPMNVRGVLEAAHAAIEAFFLLSTIFESEAKVWWVFNHRAFLEAMRIANILKDQSPAVIGGLEYPLRDPLFARVRVDLLRIIDLMQKAAEGENGCPVARTRVSVLNGLM